MTKIATDKGASAPHEGNYTFGYDSLNRRIKRTLPSHTYTTYAYDQNSRLTNITHKNAFNQVIDSVNYTHDNVGNRITKTEEEKTLNYSYDAIYRLTKTAPQAKDHRHKLPEEIIKHHAEMYSYDSVGNRQTGPEINDSYTYDPGNELLTSKTHKIIDKGDQYEYDANGNLIKTTQTSHKGHHSIITTYAYDDENRLTNVKIQRGHLVKEVSFTYDPFGRRISKTVQREEFDDDDKDRHEHHKKDYPKTTYYVYDDQNIIAEYDHRGKLVASYVHGPNTDEPLSAEIRNDWIYYHADGLGSITALTNFMGNAIQRYEYDSFGNIKHNPHPRWFTQPYTYTGREFDIETGLYFYRARYYDPKVGRFTTKDPIGFKGGDINLYTYVGNNPANNIDPNGLAYFAKRSLHGLPWMGPFSCRPGGIDDINNTEISHEQLFFEDGKYPSNIGFFDDGTLKTEPNPTGYRCRSGHFNDCLIRKAVQNVPLSFYKLLGPKQSNCQDWADAVRQECNKLSNDSQAKCECKI